MKLPKFAVEYSSFTWMVFVFLTIVGIRALVVMPRTENPEVSVPGSSIVVTMPGASPVDMENLVALPIEEALNELEEIDQISTSVREGIAAISVEFDFNTDADEKYEEVVRQVNSVRNELPDEIMQTEVWQWTTTDVAMLQLALVSDSASFRELEKQAEKLQKIIEKNEPVKAVDFYALPEQEVHISLDFEKMARVNTSLEQVEQSIKSNNANIPGGDLEIGDMSLSVKSSGAYKDLDEMRNTVVNAYEGKLIYLKNIAEVQYGYENLKYFARYGGDFASGERMSGKRAIFLTISQKEGLNVLETHEMLKPYLAKFDSGLPEGISL